MTTIARIWTADVVAVEIVADPDDPLRPIDRFMDLRTAPVRIPPPYSQTAFSVAAKLAVNYLRQIGQEPRLEILDPELFADRGPEELRA